MSQRITCAFIIIFLGLCLSSCMTQIDGSLAANGSASMSVSMSLQPRMSALIRVLSAAGGRGNAALDGPAIARSMSAAPGVQSAVFRNTSAAAIEGQVRIYQINEFLSVTNEIGFITFEQRTAGGRCVINIERSKSPEILVLLSSEISDYLNALMAPIATGEELSKSEYLDLVSSFYNRAISDEISSSRVRASIEFPGTVTNVTGGTFSGRRANFDIPLLDLLVLETPMIFEVNWN
ncbi:MAG: hypothetical protein FWB83_03330 [Treponema sp.]|nr:hypothetical protein [Treponema sp.]